ncbi:hypothetical protein CHCC15290_4341 [Bacillus licheniformis]|uniref:Uncharacterized protein n=1 Tax=Bacillus licheniformis TaxID=1402 RepID=A0A8B5YBY1_BACLI|nr:hypothetical protein MUY_004226 [Bacillus licheniformis WX-02]AMR12403.1 hypothetical protein AB684_20330 [Bacillus licheniformis]EQM25737.1 hypothetical protein N399_22140 [Bacillus licheniformis CG-B52]KUL12074.1 hypothetical protein LI17339_04910 [Bacillus licheniformis LMG 17339]KYC78236.1 hypothetical protein B4090_4404 [Bacillus licheniformis]
MGEFLFPSAVSRQLRAYPIINIFCYCGNKFFLNYKKTGSYEKRSAFRYEPAVFRKKASCANELILYKSGAHNDQQNK